MNVADSSSSTLSVRPSGVVAVVALLTSILVMSIVVWSLDKGIGFSDESWYLLHLRPGAPSLGPTSWDLLAGLFYPSDLLRIRQLTVFLLVAANIVLAIGIYRYFKLSHKLHLLILISLACTGQFVLNTPVQFVPSYLMLKIILVILGTGLFLIGLDAPGKLPSRSIIFTSGFVLGFLPLVLLPNTPYLLVVVLFLWMHRRRLDEARWVLPSIFVTGSILALALYFLFLQGPADFADHMAASLQLMQYDETHGAGHMAVWILKTLWYLVWQVLVVATILFLLDYHPPERAWLRAFMAVFAVCFLVVTFVQDTAYSRRAIMPLTLLLIFYFAALIRWSATAGTKHLGIFLLLFSIPLFASIGTDIEFRYRGPGYVSALFGGAYVLVLLTESWKWKWGFILLLILTSLNFARYPSIVGWSGQILAHQSVPVSRLGIQQRILLDTSRARSVKEFLYVVPRGSMLILSDISLWGYVYLGSGNTPYLDFLFREEYFFDYLSRVRPDVNDFTFVENKDLPFSPQFFGKLQEFGLDTAQFRVVDIRGDVRIYLNINKARPEIRARLE